MDAFGDCLRTMEELFAHDCQFALATACGGVPSVRYVDTFYDQGAFYIVTSSESEKAKEIDQNPRVALCSRRLFRFSGTAENIGHPLAPENAAIRGKLIEAFAPWYFRHNDEHSREMCYIRIMPDKGFFHGEGIGWRVDFASRTAETFPFHFDIDMMD